MNRSRTAGAPGPSKASEPKRSNPFNLSSEKSLKSGKMLANIESLVALCSEKLGRNASHSKALYVRASCFMRLGELELALKDCNRHMEIELDSVEGLYLRGSICQRLGDVQAAIRDFDLVLASDPHHFNARLARAACYNYVGDFDRAIEDYENGLNTEESTNRVAKRIFNIKNALSTDVLINPTDHEDFRLESPTQTKHDSFYRDRTPASSTLTSFKTGSESKAAESSLRLSGLLPEPSPKRKPADAAEADR